MCQVKDLLIKKELKFN